MATTTTHLPSARQLGQAFLVGVYTAAMTFLAGVIDQGAQLGEQGLPDWKLAVQAGLAAGLAFIGWTGISTTRR